MNRETQSVLTGLLGGLLISITLSGKYTSYVKPGFEPMLLIAGGVLIAVAVISLVLTVRAETRAHRVAQAGGVEGEDTDAAVHDEGSAHEGHQHGGVAPWLVLVPVLVLLFVAPPALGADSVARSLTCGTPPPAGTTYPSRRTAAEQPLPAQQPVPLSMQEFISRSLYDAAYSTATNDVQVEGFIAASSCTPEGYTLVRLKISCCAADAIALRVHVDSPAPYPANTWVRAVVRAVKDTGDQANNYVPTATVVSMTRIEQPADPYET